jgi:hypothetical protein
MEGRRIKRNGENVRKSSEKSTMTPNGPLGKNS